MPIQLLAPAVSARIAAGEVIERPASAVKELVENALDAGATRVAVELRGGGVEYIRVTDNGSGIPPEQVELAFQRFATSKLGGAGDLESVATLGFRGEALPSVAAVSRVEMRTRTRGRDDGFRIEIADGEILSAGPDGAPVGTTVVARHLFRNFPVRRKFLRSAAAEQTRIQMVVSHYAMAYPEVRFELSAERGRGLSSPGGGDLRDAVAAVHGARVAEALLELTPADGGESETAVSGLIGPPAMDRANRRYISLFANRRWVHNRSLSYAVEQSYHGFMAERRYPVAVLNVSVPYEEVDVNTHPSKAEIRFKRENRVFGAVQRAVRGTLTLHAPVPEVSPGGASAVAPSAIAPPPNPSAFWPTRPFQNAGGIAPHGGQPPISGGGASHAMIEPPAAAPPPPAPPLTPKDALPILRVLGQINSAYIVAEGPDGMYLIDQHAAHERVMFERVKRRAASGTADVQSLLEPAVVELDAAKMELATRQAQTLSDMGFRLESFGVSSVIVRGVPALLNESDQSRTLLDVLDLMEEGGGFETWEDRAAYSIACHSAIRAGKTLSMDEMQELARQLEACAQPNTCPHGRPTMIHMSAGQMEREFHRT